MNVSIKDFGLDLDVKNRGIELGVKDSKGQIGDLIITKSGLTWCKGKTRRNGGVRVTWTEFANFMENR